MRWVDTPSAGRSGFVWSRLIREQLTLAEIARYGGGFYVEFTRFAPEETRRLQLHEFKALDDAKAWAVAMVRLS